MVTMVKCLQKLSGAGDQIQNLLYRQSWLQLTLANKLIKLVNPVMKGKNIQRSVPS